MAVPLTQPVRLLTHGAEMQALGGPTVRVPATALALRALGMAAEASTFRTGQDRAADIAEELVHVFNHWDPHSALSLIRDLRSAGKCVVFSPICLDFTDRAFWEFALPTLPANDLPTALAQARHHARGPGRLHEPVPGYHAMLREMVALSDHLILLSPHERDLLAGLGILPEGRSSIVKNPVDCTIWQRHDPDLFRTTHLHGDPSPYVLTLGRIEPRKNQLLLARAMRGLAARLVVIGQPADPAYAARLRDEAGTQLIEIGRLPPASAMLRSAISGAAAFALPSWSEGASLAALEAAALGAPLLLGNLGAERDYFGDHATYADPGDPLAIRAGIEALIHRPQPDPALVAQVARENSPDAYARATAEAYTRALAAPRRTVTMTKVVRENLVLDVTGLTPESASGRAGLRLATSILTSQPTGRAIRFDPMLGAFRSLTGPEAPLDRAPLAQFSAQDRVILLGPGWRGSPSHRAALNDLAGASGAGLIPCPSAPESADLIGVEAALSPSDLPFLPVPPATRPLAGLTADGFCFAPDGLSPAVDGDFLRRLWRHLARDPVLAGLMLVIPATDCELASGLAGMMRQNPQILLLDRAALGTDPQAVVNWLYQNARATLLPVTGDTPGPLLHEARSNAARILTTVGAAMDPDDVAAWRVALCHSLPQSSPPPANSADIILKLLCNPNPTPRPPAPFPGVVLPAGQPVPGLAFGAGWGPARGWGREITGPEAHLRLDCRGVEGGDIRLILNLRPGPENGQPAGLGIIAGDLPLLDRRFDSGHVPEQILITAPRACLGADGWLDLRLATRPASRLALLGLCLQEHALTNPLAVLRPGRRRVTAGAEWDIEPAGADWRPDLTRPLADYPLDLAQADTRAAVLGPGWAGPDPTGLWSEGSAALLTLPAGLWRAGGALRLSFATLPRLAGEPPLILRAEALLGSEGCILARAELRGGQQDLSLPLAGIWPEGQALTIALYFDALRSPRELGINADPRELGIFLVRIAHDI